MRIKIIVVCIYSLMIFHSCFTSEKQVLSDLRRINECSKNWVEKSFQETINVRVLLFENKKTTTTSQFPAFVIGVTSLNDTIALLDKSFDGKIKVNQIVNFGSTNWSNEEKSKFLILPNAGKDRTKNSLYCNVRFLYRGKISLVE